MGKHRTPYPEEFRAQMVELVKAGRTPGELSRELEPTAQTIYNWVAQAGRDTGVRHDGLTTAERQELTKLRRETVVLDVFSRRIMGWAMSYHLYTELMLRALDMALSQRRPVSVIHHSDQGCPTKDRLFGQTAATRSLSGPGSPYSCN